MDVIAVDDSPIGRVYASGRWYEEKMLRYIYQNYPDGLRFVDVGAHIGGHSLFFALHCAAQYVVAIEPSDTYALLVQNIRENDLESIVIAYRLGAGEKKARARCVSVEGCSGMTSIELGGGPVEVLPLDEITGGADILKIDVEGMGADVLRGARGILGEHPSIFIECRDEAEYADVEEVLRPYGYQQKERFNSTPTYLFE